jgi:hypothetical protein
LARKMSGKPFENLNFSTIFFYMSGKNVLPYFFHKLQINELKWTFKWMQMNYILLLSPHELWEYSDKLHLWRQLEYMLYIFKTVALLASFLTFLKTENVIPCKPPYILVPEVLLFTIFDPLFFSDICTRTNVKF